MICLRAMKNSNRSGLCIMFDFIIAYYYPLALKRGFVEKQSLHQKLLINFYTVIIMSPRFFSKSEAVLFGWNALRKTSGSSGTAGYSRSDQLLIGLVMSSFSEEAPTVLVIAVSKSSGF
jgi:hypothetical protein